MTKYLLYGLLIYLAAINIVAFFLYGIDKWKARQIPLRTTDYSDPTNSSNHGSGVLLFRQIKRQIMPLTPVSL